MQLIDLIAQVEANQDLDQSDAAWLMGQIMSGSHDPQLVKRIILALKAKGEASSEVIGFVNAMLDRTERIELAEVALDIVGTGGDQSGSVNISSTASLIAAGAGAIVIKHGNRAASSKSGSADVLEALNIRLDLSAKQIAMGLTEVGIGFCFAPYFHPAMKNVAPIRKEIGVPTIFNILGPLANPAQPQAMLVGVADANRIQIMADVLAARGCVGFIARGDDGLDELTLTTTTSITEFGESFDSFVFDPTNYGFSFVNQNLLTGGTASENAQFLLAALTPDDRSPKIEAIRATSILNAAGGLVAYWKKSQLHQQLSNTDIWQNAVVAATESVYTGAALNKLIQWQEFCASVK